MRKGNNKKGSPNTPSQVFTLEDPEFFDLRISNEEHQARFALMARMGIQNTRFASEEVVECGIHGSVLPSSACSGGNTLCTSIVKPMGGSLCSS